MCARARAYASLASICTTQACTDINGILGPVLATVTSKTHVLAFMSTHTHAFAFMTTHQLSVLADSNAHGLHSAMALHIRQSFSKSATSCDPQSSSCQPVLRDSSRGERGRGGKGGERGRARERGGARERGVAGGDLRHVLVRPFVAGRGTEQLFFRLVGRPDV